MPLDGWLAAALVAMLVAHVLTIGYALLVRRRSADTGDEADPSAERPDCHCPECGASNDPTFQYCKRCVSELPGRPGAASPGGGRSHHH